MSRRTVRVVVAEGASSRSGLLRFVLEGEGYDVVGEASASADLARELALHRPDVVVIDDGIGATAVAMVHEMVPGAKVILAWPGDVVPIGSDARVDPSSVLRELGPAVERLTGVPCATGLATSPDAPSRAVGAGVLTLGEMLARRREIALRHPTPLEPPSPQERGTTAAPVPEVKESAAAEAAGIVMLPAATGASGEPPTGTTARPIAGPLTLAELTAAAAAAAAAPAAAAATGGGASSGWYRRLGTIALGGTAVAGSLVLAMALSSNRVPVHLVGQGFTPSVSVTPSSTPSTSPGSPVVTPSPPVGDLGGPALPPGGNKSSGSGSSGNGGGAPPPPPSSHTPPPTPPPTTPPGPPGPPTPVPPGPPGPPSPPPTGGGHGQGHGNGNGDGHGNGNGEGQGPGGEHHHHEGQTGHCHNPGDGDHDGDDHGGNHGHDGDDHGNHGHDGDDHGGHGHDGDDHGGHDGHPGHPGGH